jgi:abequosyltransferase
MKKLLSILIPTKNRKDFLKKNLISLASIIYKFNYNEIIEIVISDNNSSDDSYSLVKEFALKNKELFITSVLNTIDLLPGDNFYKAIKSSTGRYIMFLGDDDYISGEYLNEVISLLKSGSIQTIFTNSFQRNIKTNQIKKPRDRMVDTKVYGNQYSSAFLLNKANNLSGHVFLNIKDDEKMEYIYSHFYYPHIYSLGLSINEGLTAYVSKYPLEITISNKVFWRYEPLEYLQNMLELNSIIAVNFLQLIIIDFMFLLYQGFHRVNPGGVIDFIFKLLRTKKVGVFIKGLLLITISLDTLRIIIKHLLKSDSET